MLPATLLLLLLLSPAATAAAATAQPSILLFFPDELRYDWGGIVNNPYYSQASLPLHTPHFDWLAEGGTRFTRAFVASPVCAPSRATLASGRQYDEAGVPMNFHNDFNLSIPTIYQALQRAGYWTMVTGRDDLDKSSGGPGLNGTKHTAQLGFSDAIRCDGSTDVTRSGVPHEPYGEYLWTIPVENATIAKKYKANNLFVLLEKRFAELGGHSYAIPDPLPLPDAAYQDNWIGRQAMTLLQRKPAGQPWFIEVSHQAPHPPMDITADMMATVRRRRFPMATNSTFEPSVQEMGRQNYAGKIERLDYWLGTYIHYLNSTGELNSTLICLCSDHGEMLFDRSTTAKSKPWNSASSVPLVCRGPGVAASQVITSAVSTMDLAATFLDYAGAPKPAGMTSQSLRPVLEGGTQTPNRKYVQSGLNNFRVAIRTDSETEVFKLICCNGPCPGSTRNDSQGMGRDEIHLFNIAEDRFEQPNSDLRHARPDVLKDLLAILPPAHQTAPNPNSSVPKQRFGYRWTGCHYDEPLIHKGCYKDETSESPDRLKWDPRRDLPLNMGGSPDMTPGLCVGLCAAGNLTHPGPFRFAGVQLGSYCLCGDSFGRYGPAGNCTMPCSGDPSATCGNRLMHDVYQVTDA